MTLLGLISDYPLPELLFDLGSRGRSGWLTLCSGRHEVQIALCNGFIASAATTDIRSRLGQRFVDNGQITDEQLEALLSDQHANQQKSTGELLVESGYVTDSDVQRVLAEQVGDLLFGILITSRGCFAFRHGTIASQRIPANIPLQHSVLQAISRADEWIGQQIESASMKLADEVTPEMLMPSVLDGWPVVEAMLDGASTLEEVIKLAEISHDEARTGISVLISNGVVHLNTS